MGAGQFQIRTLPSLDGMTPNRPTSRRCPSAWQPNLGRGSTYRRGKSVQTTGTSSLSNLSEFTIDGSGSPYVYNGSSYYYSPTNPINIVFTPSSLGPQSATLTVYAYIWGQMWIGPDQQYLDVEDVEFINTFQVTGNGVVPLPAALRLRSRGVGSARLAQEAEGPCYPRLIKTT